MLALIVAPVLTDAPLQPANYVGWWAAELLFGGVYLQAVWHWPRLPDRPWWFYLSIMTLAAVACSWFTSGSIGGMLSMVVASLLPWVAPPRIGISWMTVQSVLVALAVLRNPEVNPALAILLGATFLGLGFFAYIASMAARELSLTSTELTRVNSELRATQSLLAENTRIAERVRIARELHDLVGHHLTALTLNLEVSTHLIEGKALEHVEQARSIARLLLTDVREVVSEMRSNDGVNLADAVRMLTDGVPRPRIHLDIPDNFKVTDPQRAQVLLRCAQEAITNAVRHSGASNLWLSLHSENQELELQVRDDGSGASAEDLGNGLRGMRERLRQLGGELVLTSALGQGFNLHVHLPMEHSV
jgi:signal transduction histidine kinase